MLLESVSVPVKYDRAQYIPSQIRPDPVNQSIQYHPTVSIQKNNLKVFQSV